MYQRAKKNKREDEMTIEGRKNKRETQREIKGKKQRISERKREKFREIHRRTHASWRKR